MTHWKVIKIGDLGEVITGNTPLTTNRTFYGGPYPFIKPTDMEVDRRRVVKWEETYSEKAFKKYKNAYVPAGSTGVVTIGTVGEKIFQADQDCFTNQSVNVVVPYSEYDKDFVYYLLKYNLPSVASANPGTASGRHHVSKSNFCALKVRVPEYGVQKRIGTILSGYDNLIENNLHRISILEELARITYEDWFVNSKKIKNAWSKLKLGQLISHEIGGGWGEEFETNEFSEAAFVIRGTDINEIPLGGLRDVPYRYHKKSNLLSRKLQNGDIVFEVSGGSQNEGVAKTLLITNRLLSQFSGDVMCASFCKLVRPLNRNLSSYIFLFLKFLRETKATEIFEIRSASNIVNYNWTAFLKFQNIVVPDEKTLERFNAVVNPIYEQIYNLGNQNRILREARDILLPRLMSGAIKINNSDQHVSKIISSPKGKEHQPSWEFKEAVLISMLTEKFSSKQYPLGRKRYTKFSYLFHRHVDNQIQDYLRKAAGPYNPKTKYQGPEKIAHENGYVQDYQNGKLSGFIPGENIAAAKTYFQNYWSMDYLTWLETHFKYKSNDELELYATVDNAMLELYKKNKPINVQEVKTIIKTEKEWKAKLEREIFSDDNIQKAINYLPSIFHYS